MIHAIYTAVYFFIACSIAALTAGPGYSLASHLAWTHRGLGSMGDQRALDRQKKYGPQEAVFSQANTPALLICNLGTFRTMRSCY